MTIDNAFATVLKRLRKEKEESQESFSFSIGIHRTYISQLERGLKSPSLRTIEKICKALEISITEFFSQVEQEQRT
ncbi:helix-turn-helix domain-containing protein [Candidatus Uabimicrobium sp. HlEnr_7]|uniref:helix-turn-helix domain-containing protein n=1 Tax=Candidatus Uabimicrobium helgolandensis TaxID=3095367 RepID=UPI003555CC7B